MGVADVNVLGIIQARMTSSRLPGKILAPLAGEPLLRVLARRIEPARVDEWWLATSKDASDDVTAAWGRQLGLRVWRGSLSDVLSRFVDVVMQRPLSQWIVRVTADDPYTHWTVIDALISQARDLHDAEDMVGPDPVATPLPLGYVPQIVRADALLEAHRRLPADSPHREHVVSWLVATGRQRPFRAPRSWPARPGWRWTIDTPEDLLRAERVFAELGSRWPVAGYRALVRAHERAWGTSIPPQETHA